MPPRSGWDANRYALAVLTGIIAITAFVIVADIIFSPAHLSFAVANASGSVVSDGVNLGLILAANNTSRHTGVWYGVVNVDFWYSEADWLTADVVNRTSTLLPQPPRSTVSMNVSIFLPHDVWQRQYAGEEESTPFTVRVTAQVWFKIGRAYTRPYIIRVSCSPVDFFAKTDRNETFAPVNCTD